jgi:hypothetical protein
MVVFDSVRREAIVFLMLLTGIYSKGFSGTMTFGARFCGAYFVVFGA